MLELHMCLCFPLMLALLPQSKTKDARHPVGYILWESFVLLLPGYSYPLGLTQDQLLEKLILTMLYMDKFSLHAHTYQHTYTCAYTPTYILTYKHEHINTHVHMCTHRYQMHIIHAMIIYRYMLTHEHIQVGSCMNKNVLIHPCPNIHVSIYSF